jgi:hypothetical protein
VTSFQQQPQVTPLADGRVLFTWQSSDPAVDGSATGIAARVFVVPPAEDMPIEIPLTVALTDTDGSEALQRVVIADLPDGFSLAAGERQPDGTWLIDRAQGAASAAVLDDLADGAVLTLTPQENFNGSFTLSITAASRETANGDEATSAAIEIPVTVAPVSDAPAGTDNTVTVNEDTAYVFTAVDFGFSDVDGDTLAAVKIATLPAAGALTNDGVPVTAGQTIPVADINAGKLTFTPAPDAGGDGYAGLTFQVQDGAGTANGGAKCRWAPNSPSTRAGSIPSRSRR